MEDTAPRSKCILIVGAGRTGRALARMLSDAWEIIAMDIEPLRLAELRTDVPSTRPLRLFPRDGTSLLNLQEAGLARASWVAALTDSDEINIEVCRLALSVARPPALIGVVSDAAAQERLKALGAEAIARPAAVAGLVANTIDQGVRVAVSVGLGRGEVVEIPVLPSSPAVDTRVADLRARRWLVAAIYRGGEILVPHGDVVIRRGDRLLLSGEPDLLPHIADYLRAGVARFPLQYGRHLVVAAAQPVPGSLWEEVAHLAGRTRATGVHVLGPAPPTLGAAPTTSQPVDSTTGLAGLLAQGGRAMDAGCLILPKEEAGLLRRVGLVRPAFTRLLELLPCPTLLSAGSHPYRRILLPVADSQGTALSAELAIDLARQLELPITAVTVTPPAFVVGHEAIDDQRRALRTVTEAAALYHLPLEEIQREGNPVVEITAMAGAGDLLVVASRPRRPSLFRPDTSLLLIDRARCSVMVVSYRERIHGGR